MTRPPPRLRPRDVRPPAQPYPVAADYTPPAEDDPPVDVETDEAPFPLRSDDVPTMKDLSRQIGMVDRRVRIVRRETALTRKELGELRGFVMGDQAPRLTQVEAKTRAITIPPIAKKGAAFVGVGSLYPLLEWLIPLIQKWFESR